MSKIVYNVDLVYVKDIKVYVMDGKVIIYGVICKILFCVMN